MPRDLQKSDSPPLCFLFNKLTENLMYAKVMFISAKTVPSFNYLFFQEDKDRQKDSVTALSFIISTSRKNLYDEQYYHEAMAKRFVMPECSYRASIISSSYKLDSRLKALRK
jgi:hypothetical protein